MFYGVFANSKEQGNDGGGRTDKAEIGLREFVIAGGDAAEVLDSFEEVLHDMPLSIGRPAIGGGMLAVGARWNTRLDATLHEPLAEAIAVVTLVSNEHGSGDFFRHGWCMANIGFITRAQEQPHGLGRFIDHRVNLGVQATLGAAHSLRSLTATRIARAAMHFDVRGVQEAPRTRQRQLDPGKELRPDSVACPLVVIPIDTVPSRLGSVNGPPLATLTENDENSPHN